MGARGPRIVVIGAGSRSFGRGQVVDVLSDAALGEAGAALVLVDTDARALEVMTRFARRVAERTRTGVRVEGHAGRERALDGADFVLTAVAVERMPLWEQDYRVPASHGFRHVLGENGGPGALFHALRSLGLVMPICRDVERLCPGALLLNFTNPEQRVLHAVLTLTEVRAAGLCHGVFGAIDALAKMLGCARDDLEVTSAGLNHFYAVLRAVDRRTGADRLAEALARVVSPEGARWPPLFRKFAEVFGVFTFPSDDHIGEYVAWGAEFEGAKWPYGQESRKVRPAPAAGAGPSLGDWAEGRAPLDERALAPSGEIAARVIRAIALNEDVRVDAVNVLNAGPFIENLPATAAVEVPARVDGAGLHPIAVGAIPEPMAAMMRTQTTITSLVTEAWRTRDRRLLLQALLMDPVVDSIRGAEALLDEMLELQADFLPEFR